MALHGAPRAAVRQVLGPDTDLIHGNLIMNEMRGCTRELRASGKQMVRGGNSALIRQEDCNQVKFGECLRQVMLAHDPYFFFKAAPLASKHLILQRDAWGFQGGLL